MIKHIFPKNIVGTSKSSVIAKRCADVLSGLTVATLLFGLVRAMLFFYVLMKSTESLHKRMFDAILRAPVHFFDMNPIGRRKLLFDVVIQIQVVQCMSRCK